MKFAIKFLLRAFMLCVVASALALLALGQVSTSNQGRVGRTDPVQRELQRQFEREIIENALRERPARHAQPYAQPVLAQIREDFLRLQVIDRKMMQALSESNALDLEFVTKSAAEIKKLARRLKKNLALDGRDSAATSRAEIEVSTASLRLSLYELSKLIEQFVSNPMFKEARLADVQLATKARRDIQGIIELSGEVKSSSQRLKNVAEREEP
jgi:hypothetical protein